MSLRQPFANYPFAFAEHTAKSRLVLPHPVGEHAMLFVGRSVSQPTGPAQCNDRSVHKCHCATRSVELLLYNNRIVPVSHLFAADAGSTQRHGMIPWPRARIRQVANRPVGFSSQWLHISLRFTSLANLVNGRASYGHCRRERCSHITWLCHTKTRSRRAKGEPIRDEMECRGASRSMQPNVCDSTATR
jgi:hypothetical protein